MIQFASTGVAITGAEYRKRPFGPTCDSALRAVRELELEGWITTSDTSYYGYTKKEFHLIGQPRVDALSEVEVSILDEMTSFVCREHTARGISEFSHDVSWQMVEMGNVIPYHLSFNLVPSIVSAESFAWAEEAADQVERTRSEQDPLEFEEFSVLRGRLLEARG